MNNIEEKLSKIKTKPISEDEKNSLWYKVSVAQIKQVKSSKNLSVFNIFNFTMKKYIAGFIALVVIVGGGGVVAASNSAMPGDFLFPVDLAVEKIQIRLALGDKKEDLKFKFAEERISEVKSLAEKRGASVLITNLASMTVSEIEAEIFTNETLVKIEAGDRKYGFTTNENTEDAIINEIAQKYSLNEEVIRSIIFFSREDRESRANDKEFLNKTNSVVFSSDEDEDVGVALTNVNKFLQESSDSQKTEQIQKILRELLVLLGDDSNVRVEKKDDEIKIKSDSGRIEIKYEDKNDDNSGNSKKSDGDDRNDDNKKQEDSKDDDSNSSSINTTTDVREDDSEVFCRGEWRDQEDCDDREDGSDSDDDDDEEDEDNSGRGRGGDDN